MSKIEKIKSNIEERIALAEKCANAACEKNLHNTLEANELLIRQYKSLLDIIDSISEEKPSEDLEVAAEKYLDTLEVAELFCGSYEAWQVSDAFKAGAEWQKQRDAELIEIAYNDGITIGKTKQKEQMMKDAVEGEIENSCFGIVYLRKNLMNEGYSTGDKVKILIVKEKIC